MNNQEENTLEVLLKDTKKYHPTILKEAISNEINVSKDHFYKLMKKDKHLVRSIKIIHLLTSFPVGELIGYDKTLDLVMDEHCKEDK